MSDDFWIERAQSAEAKLATLQDQYAPALERVKQFKANFGVRERDNGEITVNYEKFAQAIGIGGALELRAIIDQMYSISGEAGEKPRVRLKAKEENG